MTLFIDWRSCCGVHERGILLGTDELKGTQQVEVAIDARSQAELDGSSSSSGVARFGMAALSESIPDLSIPITVSKMTLPLTVDYPTGVNSDALDL